jgi:CubicO group peptidase (beta-lactamase class C family)
MINPYLSTANRLQRGIAEWGYTLSVLVLILGLAACETTSSPTAGDERRPEASSKEASNEQSGSNRVSGPDGEFSAPLPDGWKARNEETHAVLRGPGGDVRVYLTAIDGSEASKVIKKGWKRVGIKQTFDVRDRRSPPVDEPFDELTVVTYELSSEKHFRQAVVRRIKDRSYLTLIDGPLADIQKRNSQIRVIDSGIRVEGTDVTTLKGVEPNPWSTAFERTLAEHIRQKMQAFDVPGAAIGVVQDGKVVWSQGFGTRIKRGAKPVTTRTRMMIGSTTKTMTAMLMAQGVDAGKFEWTTPASDVMPEFRLHTPELTDRVAMKHFLCACTGIPRRDLEIMLNFDDLTAEGVVEQLATFEPFTEFGTAFQYSNQMVAAGGYATTVAFGGKWGSLREAYNREMRRRLFNPIGMDSTTLDFDRALKASNRAEPHGMTLKGTYTPIDVSLERFTVPVSPAGAAWSNVEDMTRYLRTQLAGGRAPDGERVVSKANLQETWTPQVKIAEGASYGLGWIVTELKGKRVVEHNGNTMGFTSNMAFIPGDEVGVVILANAWGANSFSQSVRGRLFELLYERDLKVSEGASYARKRLAEEFESLRERLTSFEASKVEPFLGTWKHPALGTLTIRRDDGRLVYDVGEFAAELKPLKPRDDKPSDGDESEVMVFLTVKPQVGGTLRFETTENGRRIAFGRGATEYTFTPLEDE